MTDEWRQRVTEAQQVSGYTIGARNYPRVRYGDEPDDWGADRRPCGDCAVVKGQYHVPGCDVERCPKCGGQSISCGCDDEDMDDLHAELDRLRAENAALLKLFKFIVPQWAEMNDARIKVLREITLDGEMMDERTIDVLRRILAQ